MSHNGCFSTKAPDTLHREVFAALPELYNSLQRRGRWKDLPTGGNYRLFHLLQLSGSEKRDFMSSTNRQANDQQATPLPLSTSPNGIRTCRRTFGSEARQSRNCRFRTHKDTIRDSGNRLGRINPSAPEDSNITPGQPPAKNNEGGSFGPTDSESAFPPIHRQTRISGSDKPRRC